MSDKSTVSMSPEDLQKLIATAVATAVQEVRKPAPPTKQEEAQRQQEQEQRMQTGSDAKRVKDNQRQAQLLCSHEHTRREGGGTHAVWVRESFPVGSPGYIYCQKCYGRFRPEQGFNRKLDPQAHYNTQTFNKLFQDCNEGEILGR